MALPPLTPEQRAAALEKAAIARRERAAVKNRLKHSGASLIEVLKEGSREGGNDIVGKMKVSAVLEPFKKRNTLYNQRVRDIAAKYDAVLVDYWCFDAYKDSRMWAPDRLHMSKAGHKYLAAQVLDHLNVPHKISPKEWDPPTRISVREWERKQRRWVNDWVVPLFGRKLRGVTLGDTLSPRWPHPVEVPRKGGLKKLMEEATK